MARFLNLTLNAGSSHQRARNTLVSLRLVEVKDDFYSLGDKAT